MNGNTKNTVKLVNGNTNYQYDLIFPDIQTQGTKT
jgi:hypothetical protein